LLDSLLQETKMEESGEQSVGSLQPWQVYSALYLGFYCTTVYFDHFLISFVFCIAFGVICEITTRYMNGESITQISQQKVDSPLDSLVTMARSEAKLVPSLTQMAKVEATTATRPEDLEEKSYSPKRANEEDDNEEIEEDFAASSSSPPPPLPEKDYLSSTESTMDAVNNRLSQVMEASFTEEKDSENQAFTDASKNSDFNQEIPPLDLKEEDDLLGATEDEDNNQAKPASDYDNYLGSFKDDIPRNNTDGNDDILRHVTEGHCPVIDQLQQKSVMFQDNQDTASATENIRSMSEIKRQLSSDTEEEEEEEAEEDEDVFEEDKKEKEKEKAFEKAITESMIDREINLLSTSLEEDDVEEVGEMHVENDVTETEAQYIENNITKENNKNNLTKENNEEILNKEDTLVHTNTSVEGSNIDSAATRVDKIADNMAGNIIDNISNNIADNIAGNIAGNINDDIADNITFKTAINLSDNPAENTVADIADIITNTTADTSTAKEENNYGEFMRTKLDDVTTNMAARDDDKASPIVSDLISIEVPQKEGGAEGLKKRLEGEKKFYAPDSSSDEELEEEYAKREVDLNESESEEEEYKPRDSHLQTKPEKQNGEDVEELGEIKDDILPAPSSQVTFDISEPQHSTPKTDEFSDLDLKDPELEQAAIKIAAAFKGFKARQKFGK